MWEGEPVKTACVCVCVVVSGHQLCFCAAGDRPCVQDASGHGSRSVYLIYIYIYMSARASVCLCTFISFNQSSGLLRDTHKKKQMLLLWRFEMYSFFSQRLDIPLYVNTHSVVRPYQVLLLYILVYASLRFIFPHGNGTKQNSHLNFFVLALFLFCAGPNIREAK